MEDNLPDILLDLCLACKERHVLIGTSSLPQYHTNDGDKETPVRANFAGMPVWEVALTLSDIGTAIHDMLDVFYVWIGDPPVWEPTIRPVWFVDPDDDTHPYRNIYDVASRVDPSGVSPPTGLDRTIANVEQYEYYKKILDDLRMVRFKIYGDEESSETKYKYDDAAADPTPQTAWDNFLADSAETTTDPEGWTSFFYAGAEGAVNSHQFRNSLFGNSYDPAVAVIETTALPDGVVTESKMTVGIWVGPLIGFVAPSSAKQMTFQLSHGGTDDGTVVVSTDDRGIQSKEVTLSTQVSNASDEVVKARYYDTLPSSVPSNVWESGDDVAVYELVLRFKSHNWNEMFVTGKVDMTAELVKV